MVAFEDVVVETRAKDTVWQIAAMVAWVVVECGASVGRGAGRSGIDRRASRPGGTRGRVVIGGWMCRWIIIRSEGVFHGMCVFDLMV